MEQLQNTKYNNTNNDDMSIFNTKQINYPSFDNLDGNNHINNFNINYNNINYNNNTSQLHVDSKTANNYIATKSSENENMKQCPYCNLEFENHELNNHIYIHESQFTLFTNSEQCKLNY